MKKISGWVALTVIACSSITLSCGTDCDPGRIEPDQSLFVNILVNGRSITKNIGTIGANKPPDSVKMYLNSSTTPIAFNLINDSIIFFPNYTRNGLNVVSESIRIVCGNRLADVISYDVQPKNFTNACGDRYTFYIPENVKINSVANTVTPANVVTINK
jgi:hypothetical protein